MCNFLIRSFLTPSSHSIILILAVRSCSFRIQTRQIGPAIYRSLTFRLLLSSRGPPTNTLRAHYVMLLVDNARLR